MFLIIISLVLIIIAPVLQIIFSVLRIKGKTRLPLIVIMTLSIITGIMLSVLTAYISDLASGPATALRCSPMMIFSFGGILLIAITSPITFIISYIIYIIKQKTAATIA